MASGSKRTQLTRSKMKHGSLLLLIVVLINACAGTSLPVHDNPQVSQFSKSSPSDSLTITIEALNLSEDLSKILSTKNDELLILVYENQTEGNLSTPLLIQELLLDIDNPKKSFHWKKDRSLSGKDLLFVLLEQDYETPVEQLDPIFRVQHQHIIAAFKKRDYQTLKTYLGTEDLLGYKVLQGFSLQESLTFTVKGVYKLDLYEYNITISPY